MNKNQKKTDLLNFIDKVDAAFSDAIDLVYGPFRRGRTNREIMQALQKKHGQDVMYYMLQLHGAKLRA